MKKIGLLVDSSVGYSKEYLNKKGIYSVPIVIEIDGIEYESGINLDNELLFEKMKKVLKPFKTSSVNINTFEEEARKALKEYEKIVVLTISKHLSGTNENIKHFVETNKEFKNKVFVYESEFLTPWYQFIFNDLVSLIKYENSTFEQIKAFLDFYNFNQKGYVSPNDLERLRIGGRLTETQYKILNAFKIFPIIEVINGSLTSGKTYKIRKKENVIPKMVKLVGQSIIDIKKKNPNANIKVLYIHHDNEQMKKDLDKYTKQAGIIVDSDVVLSPEVNAHLGDKAFGIGSIEYKHWKEFI